MPRPTVCLPDAVTNCIIQLATPRQIMPCGTFVTFGTNPRKIKRRKGLWPIALRHGSDRCANGNLQQPPYTANNIIPATLLGVMRVYHGADFLHLLAHRAFGLVLVYVQVFNLLLDASQVKIVVTDYAP